MQDRPGRRGGSSTAKAVASSAATDGTSRRFDLDVLLDGQRLGAAQFLVTGLCLLAMTVDGFDLFMISMTIPAMAKDFGLAPAAIAPVVVLQNVGLTVGACLAGPLSDRFGRKPVLVFSIVGFSLLTLASTLAANLVQLSLLRMLTGAFIAGVVPNTIALTSEMTPARRRAGFVGLIFTGYGLGGMISSLLSGALLASHGWRFIFQAAGLAGLVLAPLLWVCLPESVRFLLRRDPKDPRVIRVLRRLAPSTDLSTADVVEDREIGGGARGRGPSVLELFRGKQRAATLFLWAAFMLSLAVTTAFGAWTPSVLMVTGGMSPALTGKLLGVVGFGGLIGSAASGFVLDRIGARSGLMFWFAASAICWISLSGIDLSGPAGAIAGCLAGVAMTGAQGGLNAFAPSVYPTRIRATGVGWAFGAGRLVAVVVPLFFAGLVREGGSVQAFFFALAAPVMVVLLLIPFLVRARAAAEAAVDELPAARVVTP